MPAESGGGSSSPSSRSRSFANMNVCLGSIPMPTICSTHLSEYSSARTAAAGANPCIEVDGTKAVTKYPYVGKGKGAYEQVRTYQFVGKNEGSYDQFSPPAEGGLGGSRCRRCCGWTFLVGVSVLMACIVYGTYTWFFADDSDAKRKGKKDGDLFHCDGDPGSWAGWTSERKAWCCLHKHAACPKSSAKDPFKCEHTSDHERAHWSVSHKAWCCEFRDVGCPKPPEPKHAKHAKHAKSAAQPGHASRGGHGETGDGHHTHQDPDIFDCEEHFADWVTVWSAAKKEHCCRTVHRGCVPGGAQPTAAPYDCAAGAEDWANGWSVVKRQWCCEHGGPGCDGASPPEVYDCNADFDEWRDVWTSHKKAWCCDKIQRGCEDDGGAGAAAFDCDLGAQTWQETWTPEKKAFCCEQTGGGSGCESDAGAEEQSTKGGIQIVVDSVQGALGALGLTKQ